MLFTLFTSLALVLPIAATPASNNSCTPEKVKIRPELTNMATTDKHAYLKAVNCLMELPAKTGINGTVTRFDDMHAMHQVQSKDIHIVAQFLPFHRFYMHVYEELLRDECGYDGPTPWWDETRDAGNFMASPLLDPDTGFGGNGTGPDGCVTDGPFANTTLRIGPGQTLTEHCLSRNVNEFNSTLGNETYVQECHQITNFKDFWETGGLTTHGAGHSGIGGVMADIDASPGGTVSQYFRSQSLYHADQELTTLDPLFYIHHAFVDRLWWKWQSEDPANRLYQLGGPVKQGGSEETTLDYIMTTYGIRPNVTVKDVMDIQDGYLCYEYDY